MEEDDVPPLEDMSAYVQQLKQSSVATSLAPSDQPPKKVDASLLDLELPDRRKDNSALLVCGTHESVSASNSPALSEAAEEKRSATRATATSFGGMKKGFLFGNGSSGKSACKKKEGEAKLDCNTAGPPRKESNDSTAASPGPTLLKAGPKDGTGAGNSLRLEEVQEEMRRSQPLLTTQDWITDDLLRKIEESPILAKAFQDPDLSQLMAEFQRNPEAALRAAQHRPELLQFLKEFGALMGDHFTSLSGAKAESKPKEDKPISEMITPEEEAQLKRLLRKPEVQNAMKDPDIQRLINLLKNNPEEAQKLLWANRDPDFHNKVTLLLENQVLAIQMY